jgi:5'-nucleotidase
VVCANYDFSGTTLDKYVQPYVVVKKAGLKIGIIGLLTDVTAVVDCEIAAVLKYQNPVEVTNKYAAYLKDVKKCDLVICLTHLGYDEEPYTDQMLAPKTRNVDIIVGGHSHTNLKEADRVKNLDGKDVIIVQDWKWGLKAGNLKVKF